MASQIGFQVQDFAVQVGNGTSALTAFGQQAPQALSIFGARGAIIGAIIAVGAAILGVSGNVNDMSFNFKKFAADIQPLMQPVMAVFRTVVSVLRWAMNAIIDLINLVINALNQLAVVVGALPEAFRVALENIGRRFRAFGLDVEAAALRARASYQDMVDAISGQPAEGLFEGSTMAQSLREVAASYESQAEAARRLVEDSRGFSGTIVDALENVRSIDIRDYFEQAGTAAEEAGTKAANAVTEKIQPAVENMKALGDSIKSSMSDAFMSMIDGTKTAQQAFKDMARAIILKLYEILVVQQIVNGIAGMFGGIFPGVGAQLGFRAKGGSVTGGRPYIVGERGPELMIPGRSGAIVPNGKMGGNGVTVVQNINVSTGVQQTVRSEIRSLMPQIAESAKNAVFDAQRRSVNGMGFA
jgi:phage-related minor tail protein